MKIAIQRTAAIVVFTLFLAACSPVKLPNMNYYTLDSASNSLLISKRVSDTKKTILLNNIVANPGYDTAKMLYVNIPFKLKSFASHAWVAPPATMLLPVFVSSIQKLHYFSAVVTPPYVGESDYVMSAKLLTLQQEFLRPVSSVRMAVSLTLINNKTQRVIGNKVFQSIAVAPRNNPYSGVLAANKDAQQIALQVAKYVKRRCA